jgi:CubicO group peptidase (beta-lactamase class C family)
VDAAEFSLISRRAFAAGALGLTLGSQLAVPAFAQAKPNFAPAIAAIRAYGEAHLRAFGLPGMTLGVTAPGGFEEVLNFGFADRDRRSAITPDTLFQIGSISKVMTALVIHQLAAQGRLSLADSVARLVPAVPLPPSSGITVQHLLDHVSGLPGNAPAFPDKGLNQGFRPGAHWHYSNTGYTVLGEIAESAGGKPLGQLIEGNVLRPLGMRRSRGAIVAGDRLAYAQGYGSADDTIPHTHGAQLATAAWVDVTFGAGSVASTAGEMLPFIRALGDLAGGRGGLGLTPAQGLAFVRHAVRTDSPNMSYGNGLMHVGGGGRTYLHHTGGMVGFSSAFHLDRASGAGAFASANVGFGLDYRPRLLTAFAVDALTNAIRGAGLPTPKLLTVPVTAAAATSLVGRYSGPSGTFEVRPGTPLTIVSGGQSAELQPWGGDSFRTSHPAFRRFSLMFDRNGGKVTSAAWGPGTFVREGSGTAAAAPSDPALARLAGRYTNDSPWWGTSVIVERGGKLWIGTDTELHPIGDNLWRVGDEAWSPERLSFADFIGGQPQTVTLSGVDFERHDI